MVGLKVTLFRSVKMVLFKNKLLAYASLIRLNKPIGILLLLWPTFWALWLSSSINPSLKIVFIFLAGVVLMRSAGCAINDLADKDFDSKVERTKERPLPSNKITSREALLIFFFFSSICFLLVLSLNPLCVLLSFIAFFFAVTYPFTKRFLVMPQAYLGLTFGFGIPMAYASNLGFLPMEAILLYIANFFWVVAYDTEYAMVDRDDDKKLNIKTSALLFGKKDILYIFIFHFLFLSIIFTLGVRREFGPIFFCFLFLAFLLVCHQYPMVRARSRSGCFNAFLQNNWVGAAIFIGIFLENNLQFS